MTRRAAESGPEAEPSAPADFNRLAGIYRWMEWFSFGPLLSRCRNEFLPAVKAQRAALVIGDGDGRFTARLLKENKHIVVDALDASDAMLQELRRRAANGAERIRTLNLDAREFNPSSPHYERHHYDLIVTHFFLDCLTTQEVKRLACRMRESATEGALWVVSDFAVPDTRYGRLVARLLVSALYRAFGVLTGLRVRTLPDHATGLAECGFTLLQRRERLGGLLISELWQGR